MTTAREMQAALRETDIKDRRAFASKNPNPDCSQCTSAGRPLTTCSAPSHWSGEHLAKAYADLVTYPNTDPVTSVRPGSVDWAGTPNPPARDEPEPSTGLPFDEPKPEPKPEPVTHSDPLSAALAEIVRGVLGGELANVSERIKALEAREQTHKGIQWTKPDGEVRKVDGLFHPAFEDVVTTVRACGIAYLFGPAGTGKTHIGRQVAEVLDRPFYFDSVTMGTSEGNLSGWLLPVEAGGRFVFVSVGFVKAYEEGGVYLADEFDAIDGNVAVFLNAALANGHMSLPKRHENPIAKRHPDFVFLAAGNTDLCGANRSYSARSALDLATRDRFAGCFINIGYDPVLEEAFAHAHATANIALEALAFTRSVRATIDAHQMEKVASYRLITNYSRLRTFGMSREKAQAQALQDWTRDEIAKLDAAYRPK